VLQLLPGIGPSTAAKILDKIAAEHKVVEVLKAFVVPKQTAANWPAFVTLIGRLRTAKNWPAEFEPLRVWYEPHLHRLYDDGDTRALDIAQLQQIAAGYASRERFLTELTLDPPDKTSGYARATQLDEDYTILSTIHSAKGCEWRIVRVLNVVDGSIPSAKATRTADEVEEERRLLHVATTRAKDELDLIVPHRLYQQNGHDSGHTYTKVSRFIPESIYRAFKLRQWGKRRPDFTATEPKSHSRRIDVAASVERMWQQKPEG
jgi:DNA helicase-2/ATP-dependent DNA helicase PcrA